MANRFSTPDADVELLQRLEIHLQNQGRYNLGRLEVHVADGVVRLSGRVGSFYEKQLAIHHCQRVAGVLKLLDEVEVEHENRDSVASN